MSVPASERLQSSDAGTQEKRRFFDLTADQLLIGMSILSINDNRDRFNNNSDLDIARDVFRAEFDVDFLDAREGQ